MEWYKDMPPLERHLIDIASVGTVVGTMTNYIPSLAALFTLIWTAIRIWETDTVRGLTGRDRKDDNGEGT